MMKKLATISVLVAFTASLAFATSLPFGYGLTKSSISGGGGSITIIDNQIVNLGIAEPVTNIAVTTVLSQPVAGRYLADASGADVTITLPAAASLFSGWTLHIKRIDSSGNTLEIDTAGAETIDDLSNYLMTYNESITVVFHGGDFYLF